MPTCARMPRRAFSWKPVLNAFSEKPVVYGEYLKMLLLNTCCELCKPVGLQQLIVASQLVSEKTIADATVKNSFLVVSESFVHALSNMKPIFRDLFTEIRFQCRVLYRTCL